jgi:uncharacterized membrane protein YqjE
MGNASPGGLLAALRGLLATLTECAQVRLDLLGTELEWEKRRLFDALLLAALALVLLSVGFVALCAFAILLVWDGHRLAAVAAMALVFLGLGGLALLFARHSVRNSQGLFAASVAELRHDSASLRGTDEHA